MTMTKNSSWARRLCSSAVAASVLLTAVGGPVFADPPGRKYEREEHRDYRDDRREKRDDRRGGDQRRDRDTRVERSRDRKPAFVVRDRERRYAPEYRYRERFRDYRRPPVIIHRGKPHAVPRDRVRWYRDVVVVRPFGHWYPGYAHYHRDDDAYKWLAFTAITLGLLDYLSEVQQREHEAAQIAATTAPLGERIIWQEGNASGYVVATREGTTTSGRYCREFQQEVSIGGRIEEAYGTACRNPDGSWEVVSVEGQ
jgi:hypothetical protein